VRRPRRRSVGGADSLLLQVLHQLGVGPFDVPADPAVEGVEEKAGGEKVDEPFERLGHLPVVAGVGYVAGLLHRVGQFVVLGLNVGAMELEPGVEAVALHVVLQSHHLSYSLS